MPSSFLFPRTPISIVSSLASLDLIHNLNIRIQAGDHCQLRHLVSGFKSIRLSSVIVQPHLYGSGEPLVDQAGAGDTVPHI